MSANAERKFESCSQLSRLLISIWVHARTYVTSLETEADCHAELTNDRAAFKSALQIFGGTLRISSSTL